MSSIHSNTTKAINRVKNRMRMGASLMKMHSVNGLRWYLVPGREVADDIALKVIAEPDVFSTQDGLFPGIPQTYKINGQAKDTSR